MIVSIGKRGTSFKGLGQYLTHDPKAQTNERVAWTHTHNLANDDIPCAINEMYLTAENAELLKQEAGIRAGGRRTESPVEHISVNWHPSDNPSEEHMIKTCKHLLDRMGYGDRQAIFVGHSDKPHKHAHIMLNTISPETGLSLGQSWDHARVEQWAAEYELVQGVIRCPQRSLPREVRDKTMPRNMWMAFQENEKSFLHAEELLRENAEGNLPDIGNIKNSEWKILKDIQRAERERFFADGKQQFSELRNSIYQSVREEFRERWSNYYEARKNGTDTDILRELKQGIIDEQKAALEPRRDAACRGLRESRDTEYRNILQGQQEQRQTLRWHQDLGLDTSDFFHALNVQRDASIVTEDFREASFEVTERRSGPVRDERPGRDFAEAATEAAERPLAGLGSFAVSLFDGMFTELTNLGSARPEPPSRAAREDAFRQTAEEATRTREKTLRDEEDEDWRNRSKVLHGRE